MTCVFVSVASGSAAACEGNHERCRQRAMLARGSWLQMPALSYWNHATGRTRRGTEVGPVSSCEPWSVSSLPHPGAAGGRLGHGLLLGPLGVDESGDHRPVEIRPRPPLLDGQGRGAADA